MAVQTQRADQAEMRIDERRHALTTGGDVALNAVVDDAARQRIIQRQQCRHVVLRHGKR